MSEELKPAAVHDANVFLPGSIGPVRREVVLAYEHDRVVDQLRAELAAIKAGQGEAVAIAECREVHGHICQFLNRTQHGMDTLRDGDKLYAAPPAPADAVSVPVELLERAATNLSLLDSRPRSMCRDCADCNGVCHTTGLDCDVGALTNELRALLAQSKEVE